MKEIEKQKQKQKKLRCYLLVFEVLVGIVIVFTAFREETFWNDFKAFFTGLWDILSVNGTALYKGYSALSQLAVCGIEKGVLQDVLYWVLLLLLYLITFGGMFLLIRCMWNSWKEKVLESINPWVASASIILLLIVVYLGEFIKMLLPMNLLGLWILGTIAIIGISMYVMDCIRYRR